MFELLMTVGMTVGSVLLLGYWFRYTCLLILSTKTVRDYTATVASANQLGFLDVQNRLCECATANLDQLHAALDRDYARIVALMERMPGSQGQISIETRMLRMNYCCMAAWSRLSRRLSVRLSCRALDEMSQVVAHFANVMGELAASLSAC
jgi:hypothetical protein